MQDFSDWFPREEFAGDRDVMMVLAASLHCWQVAEAFWKTSRYSIQWPRAWKVKKMPLLLKQASHKLRAATWAAASHSKQLRGTFD